MVQRARFNPKVIFDSWNSGLRIVQMFEKNWAFSLAETENQLSLDELSRDQISGPHPIPTLQSQHWPSLSAASLELYCGCVQMMVVFQRSPSGCCSLKWLLELCYSKSLIQIVTCKRKYTEGWFSSEERVHLWLLAWMPLGNLRKNGEAVVLRSCRKCIKWRIDQVFIFDMAGIRGKMLAFRCMIVEKTSGGIVSPFLQQDRAGSQNKAWSRQPQAYQKSHKQQKHQPACTERKRGVA